MGSQLRAHQPRWYVIGRSVRGASHARSGLVNQDAIGWSPESGTGPPLVLAVSDGHGSPKSFRSHIGSEVAVGLAVELMRELVDVAVPDKTQLSAIKRTAEERLPQELVRRWQQAIDAHLAEHPFTDEELNIVVKARGARDRDEVLDRPRLAYGATVLGVLIAPDFVLYLQLGDGDVLAVGEDGEVVRPIPRDARLIANETTSLCMDTAWREVRVAFRARYGDMPALVMVSTDGYANSFVNDDAFLQVGSDILGILREDGVTTVTRNLEGWLQEASEAGSGDDITLGILYREDVVAAETADTAVDAVAEAKSAETGPAPEEAPEPKKKRRSAPSGSSGGAARVQRATGAADERPDERSRADRSPIARSLIVAQIKHEGPSEPAKQGRLQDLIPGSAGEPDDGEDDVSDPAAGSPGANDASEDAPRDSVDVDGSA
ncbi:MAG: protein phosphatase 2C domain-containing protein [Anaerolineae bacterium]